jgi:hypothetical protein
VVAAPVAHSGPILPTVADYQEQAERDVQAEPDQQAEPDEQSWPTWPDPMSEPCARYWANETHLYGFIDFITDLPEMADRLHDLAVRRLLQDATDEEARRKLEERKADPATEHFRSFLPLIIETVVTRSVDNFLTYISELLELVFVTRPETLHSDQKIAVTEVLRYATREELIEALAERRVERLAYQGLSDLTDDLEARLGFKFFTSDDDFQTAVRTIAWRNLIVHNRAVVNNTFLRRVSSCKQKVGDRLRLTVDDAFAGIQSLARAVGDADVRAADKWGLDRSVAAQDLRSHRGGIRYREPKSRTP